MNRRIILPAFIFLLLAFSLAEAMIVGGLTREHQAQPGQTYKGQIVIKNDSNSPTEIKIYQRDYKFNYKGENFYSRPGKEQRSNANWITFSPHKFIVPPQQKVVVKYSVKLPDDPNLNGTYWSMLMVEKIPPGSAESTISAEDEKHHIGIRQIIRYGIQMVTQIGSTGERKLEFIGTRLLKEENKRVLEIDIENTGQRWLRPFLWTELYDSSGNYVGRFDARRRRLYPHTSVRYQLDFSDLPKGDYKALVIADAGQDYIFGANYKLEFK